MVTMLPTSLKDRHIYTQKVHARLSLHLKLDQIILNSVRTYMSDHWGNERYWERQCQPYLNLLHEHNQLARASSRPLKHYQRHVEKLARSCPDCPPNTKRANTLLGLIDEWYWREYP